MESCCVSVRGASVVVASRGSCRQRMPQQARKGKNACSVSPGLIYIRRALQASLLRRVRFGIFFITRVPALLGQAS